MKASNNKNNNVNYSFYLVQQGHQTVPLPGAFETTPVHMLQNKQQQLLSNNAYKSSDGKMFSSPIPSSLALSPWFLQVSYEKKLEYE